MCDDPSMCPLAIAFGTKNQDGSLTFLTLAKEVRFDCEIDEILEVMQWCNGHRKLAEVQVLSGLSSKKFTEVIEALTHYQIIVDARELSQTYHESSSYPLLAGHDLSPQHTAALSSTAAVQPNHEYRALPEPETKGLLALVRERRSSREFGREPLSINQLSGLLKAIYGKSDDSDAVPSAGGLYRMRVFVLLVKSVDQYKPGCYEYRRDDHGLRLLHKTMSSDIANFLLDSEGMLTEASAIICLAATFQDVAVKYANRAYRLLLLEAGHSAQNAYLYCAEQSLNIVECGGFNDMELARHLRLAFPQQGVLTTLVVGTATTEISTPFVERYAKDEWNLRHALLGSSDSPVRTLALQTNRYRDYTMPRYVAHATYRSADPETPSSYDTFNTATGCGLSIQEASVKALGEAFERRMSGMVRVDRTCARRELVSEVYDVRDCSPLHPDYVKRMRLAQPDSKGIAHWVVGKKLKDGSEVTVPIDQVFYPLLPKDTLGELGYHASSTGISAHPDRDTAIKSGLYELIERDAIAVTWYARRTPPLIPRSLWGHNITVRTDGLRKSARRDLRFCNISVDGLPVVMCVVTGPTYPHLVTGSAASDTFEEAMSKALDEAELMFHAYRGYPTHKRTIRPEKVRTVTDHALLWASGEMGKEIDWLMKGNEEAPSLPTPSWETLLEAYDPAVIDLGSDPGINVCVVRIVSKVLMPITFGFGAEHYRHPRVKMLGFEWGWTYPALPHCLA